MCKYIAINGLLLFVRLISEIHIFTALYLLQFSLHFAIWKKRLNSIKQGQSCYSLQRMGNTFLSPL